MAAKRFTFDCNCSKPDWYAYVYPAARTRSGSALCSGEVPNTGRDSKADTLVHETSHFDIIGNTDDWAYGVYESRWLALYYPTYAIRNADNHAYFVSVK